MKLAAQVATEEDPKKFHALLVELNELLQEKEHRLQTQSNPAASPLANKIRRAISSLPASQVGGEG